MGIDLKLKEIEDIFQALTVTILGTNADVRISWPTEGAPRFGITDDVAYIRIVELDNQYNRLREIKNIPNMIGSPLEVDPDNIIQQTSYTRVISVHWILYGPNSFDNAQMIRDNLFYEYPIRDSLANQNIYMIPDIVSPRRIPELLSDEWWERVDMEVSFNELVIKEVLVSTVRSAEVIVRDSDGSEIADININE